MTSDDPIPGFLRYILDRPKFLLLAAAGVLLLLLSSDWKPDPDSVHYLSMARSIATRHEIVRIGSHQWYYAPLYPIAISPTFLLNSKPFFLISFINVMTAILLMVGVYVWFARYSKKGAAIIAALVAVNIGLWDICREPRADTLFSMLVVWASVAFLKAIEARRSTVMWTIIATVLVAAACLTRQVGIFLVAGFGLAVVIRWTRANVDFSALRRLRLRNPNRLVYESASGCIILKFLIIAIVAVSVVIALMVHDHRAAVASGSITYADQFRDSNLSVASQLIEGFRRQTAEIGRLLIPGMWGSFNHQGQWLNVNTIVYSLFMIPIAMGWWMLAKKTADPLVLTFPFYFAMFVVWPFDQGTRFTVPMLPVLWGSAWGICQRFRFRSIAFIAVFIIHVGVCIGYLVHDAGLVHRQNAEWPALEKLTADIDDKPAAMINLPLHRRLMLTYLLDRPMTKIENPNDIPLSVQWLIVPTGYHVPADFNIVKISDTTQTLHRMARVGYTP